MAITDASGTSALTESMEDYLEEIYNLTNINHVARVRDIASAIGVSMSSVTGALKKLAARDLINYDKYQYITLTDQGKALAAEIKGRHRILARFLENALGLSSDSAQTNACRMEHALDGEATERFLTFLEFIESDAILTLSLGDQFRDYCQEKREDGGAPVGPEEIALANVPEGAAVVVTRIESAGVADNRIAQMGLLPGADLLVQSSDRSDGATSVDLNGESMTLSHEEAGGVLVRLRDGG